MMPEPMRTARRAAISLPSAEDGTSTAAGETALYAASSASTLGGDEVVGELGGVGREDLDRAVLGERRGGGVRTGTQVHGDGLADAAGEGQQLEGGLADGAVHVVDIDEDFSHGVALLREV
ncbi:hypothetical protein GCM10020000_69960 [Streptomyces olivoverticillatus]